MTKEQKEKRKFRNSKAWKQFKKQKAKEAEKKDFITQKPLRKMWSLHHEDLDPDNYKNLNDNFVCLNNLSHKFIHWLYPYYINDEEVLQRIKNELERMKKINGKNKEIS